jgi:hypothetical protein
MKLSQNDYEIMYDKSFAMTLSEDYDQNDTINAYLQFLDIAPKDHRKFPESYYAIAVLLLREAKKSLKDKKNKVSNDWTIVWLKSELIMRRN